MKFSVLVPVYNVEGYIEECLNSILKQTFTDYEVVLVDDGSTDGSGEICDRFVEEYSGKITVIHKQNQGLVSARRVAIGHAKGEFCVFVDSDDRIRPGLLETLNSVLKEDSNLDIILYSFSYWKNGEYIPRKHVMFPDGTVFENEKKQQIYVRLLTGPTLTAIWTKAIRTSILKSDPMDYTAFYDKNVGEDLLQSLYPVTAAKKIIYLDRPLYDYRINAGGITRSIDIGNVLSKDSTHVYYAVKSCLKEWSMDTDEWNRALDARWVAEVMYLFRQYYINARDAAGRKAAVAYDWRNILPTDAVKSINDNDKISAADRKMWNMLRGGDGFGIRVYFIKQNLYKKIRNIKRELVKARSKR